MPIRQDLTQLEPSELAKALSQLSARPFHARQIYQWFYKRDVTQFAEMTDLSYTLRERLDQTFIAPVPHVDKREISSDGTVKFLMSLSSGHQVETVFIPDTPAMTLCISTQVGCAMQCSFCLTGKMGLLRNLTAGEIAGQVRVMAHDLHLVNERFNIVLMGMGEPLHNYDETMKALRILGADCGLGVGPRRITLSTVGVLPALERLAHEPHMPNLAVSLHATTEELRNRLVPVNRKYGLADLIAACRRFPIKRRERITFEYVLLRDVNDSLADATRLGSLLHGIRSKVNLIPLNEAPGLPYKRPSEQRIENFVRKLTDRGLTVSVRKSRGRDIRAACGQLIVEGARPAPGQRAATLIDRP
jgi:23S rRNA (adenine2503-C2)-methyltransferase